ncbi:hypothetical protein [Sinomicrobium sp. M5D2P9]
MSTFYSILYVPIRPSLDEKVSIALFLRQDSEVFFHYSVPKLNIVKQLIPTPAFGLLKSYLKNIESKITELDGKVENGKLRLNDEKSVRFIEESYFSYLSQYSNNLLSFSKPKPINLKVNKELFEKLFEKYVFELEHLEEVVKKQTIFQKVRKNLYPKIQTHVNIDRHLTSNEIPNLFASTDVDFIGKNEKPVAGHTFDFFKRNYFLDNDVARFIGLTKAFELNGNNNGQYYVIGKEPSKKTHPNQHKTWKTIHDSDFLEFVPLNEIEKIDKYMKLHNVQPFFDEENIVTQE